MMIGIVIFLLYERRKRKGSCWTVSGPVILVAMGAVFIMCEPTRHVLQDWKIWPEIKVVDVAPNAPGKLLAYDPTTSMLLLPDPTREAVNTFNYDGAKGTAAAGGAITDVGQAIAVTVGGVPSAYYINSNGKVPTVYKYANEATTPWCTLPVADAASYTLYGSSIGADALYGSSIGADALLYLAAHHATNGPSVLSCAMGVDTPVAKPLPLNFTQVANEVNATGGALGRLNDVVYDRSKHRLLISNGNDISNETTTGIKNVGGVLSVDLNTNEVSWFAAANGLLGVHNSSALLIDGDDLVIAQNPGSRVYRVTLAEGNVHNYVTVAGASERLGGLALLSHENIFISSDEANVVMVDLAFVGSGQYVHDPSRNCISSNNERTHCLSDLGIATTMVCTYLGFVCLAFGTFWNANLLEKLTEMKDEWNRLRGKGQEPVQVL